MQRANVITKRNSRKAFLVFFAILTIVSTIVAGSLFSFKLQAQELPEDATDTPGIFRVGMEANYTPFNWSQTSDSDGAVPIANSPGEFVNGYDVWMAKEMSEALGLKLEVVKIEWDGLVPALTSGKIDAIIAGMSPTADRKEVIDFTDTYYNSDLVMVVKKGSEYETAQSIQDFATAKVTAQINTFHYTVLEQIENLEPEPALDAFPTMIASLLSGKLDAYVSEKPAALAAVSANPELTFVSFSEENGFQTQVEDTAVSIGLRKGSPLVEPLNQALAKLTDQKIEESMEKMIALTTDSETEAATDEEATESSSASSSETKPEVTNTTSSERKGFFATTGEIIEEYWPLFLRGSGITLLIAVLATLFGAIIGLLVEVVREVPRANKGGFSKFLLACVQFLLNVYVEVFRGTPMMVQALLIYYGSKLFFNIDMSPIFAAVFIVSINTGAYIAEVFRGGIASVPKEQFEACESLGLTHWQSMYHVILPQTIKAVLPSIGNEFVVNIKDSSVLNVISVTELFFISKSVAGTTLQIFHTYLLTALIYFVLTFLATRLINLLGRISGRKEKFSLQSTSA